MPVSPVRLLFDADLRERTGQFYCGFTNETAVPHFLPFRTFCRSALSAEAPRTRPTVDIPEPQLERSGRLDSVPILGETRPNPDCGEGRVFESMLFQEQAVTAQRPTSPWFLLAPTLPHGQESGPLEAVLLLRDEMADLAWAAEAIVSDDAGRPGRPPGAVGGAPRPRAGAGRSAALPRRHCRARLMVPARPREARESRVDQAAAGAARAPRRRAEDGSAAHGRFARRGARQLAVAVRGGGGGGAARGREGLVHDPARALARRLDPELDRQARDKRRGRGLEWLALRRGRDRGVKRCH